jgi:hypothetical protein
MLGFLKFKPQKEKAFGLPLADPVVPGIEDRSSREDGID